MSPLVGFIGEGFEEYSIMLIMVFFLSHLSLANHKWSWMEILVLPKGMVGSLNREFPQASFSPLLGEGGK